MSTKPAAVHDAERLQALRATGLLDTPAEEAFDRLTRLSVRILGIPLSFVVLVDEHRDFYKSHCGFGEPVATLRQLEDTSLCQLVVAHDEPLVIGDARAHPEYSAVQAVQTLGVGAYVGIPLRTADGHALGAFCAIDLQPRRWTEADVEVLTELARSAEREIQLRQAVEGVGEQAAELERRVEERTRELSDAVGRLEREVAERQEAETRLRASEAQFRELSENIRDVFWILDAATGKPLYISPAFEQVWGRPVAELLHQPDVYISTIHPEDRARMAAAVERRGDGEQCEEYRIVRPDGSVRWVRDRAFPVAEADGSFTRLAGIAEDITQQRAAREHFRALIENSSDITAVLDADARVSYESPSIERMLGYRPEEVVGRPAFDFVHPEDLEATRRALAEVVAEPGAIVRLEARLRHQDGGYRAFEVTGKNLLGHPAVAGIVVNAHDVTERREAAAALRQREADYRGLFENAHDALIIMDPADERVLDVNPRACALYGYAREELVGRSTESVSTDVGYGRERLGVTLERGVLRNFELAQRRADGSVIRVEVTAAVVQYRGRPAILSVNRDVTERLRAAQAVRESEARFRAIFESAPAGIALLDAGGRVVDGNPALQEMLGRTAPQLRGADFTAIAEPGDAEADARLLADVVAGVIPAARVERRYRHSGGGWFWTQVTLSAMRDEAGEPTCVLALVENTTERRAAEQALQEAVEQLRQSQKMEAVGRLAGGIAHDFNNLLMAMMAHLYVLQRDPGVPDERRSNVAEIQRVAERAAGLTRQLLDFSRRQAAAPRPLELNGVVAGMHGLLERLIRDDVALVLELDASPGVVEADPGQMEQVVMNLVVNAHDAIPQGGTITLSTRRAAVGEDEVRRRPYLRPGEYAVLAVRDSGVGIAAAELERIWEPFYTTKGVGQGTGLGLAIVYGVVKGAGGYVWVESEPGDGAVFEVYLPLCGAAPGQGVPRDGGEG